MEYKRLVVFITLFFALCVMPYHLAASEKKWRQRKSEHFIIYYSQVGVDFIDEIIDEAERQYIKITQKLGFTRYNFWLWDNRAKFYIYDDKDDFVNTTNQPRWSGGVVHYEQKIIKTYPQMSGFFDSLMPHELGHIIFREFIGNRTRVPLWFDEGVASYQERTKRIAADGAVRRALITDSFIGLEELTKIDVRNVTDRKQVDLFYAESVSVVNFLISKYGRGIFGWFCRDLRDGDDFESALWRFRCRDIKALNKKWVKYLKSQ